MAAPLVGNYTPQELEEGKEFIKEWSPKTIQDAYLAGRISLADKATMLRTHGQITHELRVREYAGTATGLGAAGKGEIQNYAMGVATEFQAAWKAAKDEDAKGVVFHSLIGSLNTLAAFDIPGNVIERWALSAGMEPDYARALNWGVWIPAQFIGITSVLKAPFKALGAAWRGAKELPGLASDFASFIKNPAEYAVRESMKLDAAALKQIQKEIAAGETAAKAALPKEAPITAFKKEAAEIEKSLPPIAEGKVRLWRGNRPDETGATAFTNDLPGIAMPFQKAYKGELSYIDVPVADLAKYETKGAVAAGAEFNLPKDIAAMAQPVKSSVLSSVLTPPVTPQQIEELTRKSVLDFYEEKTKAYIRSGVSHAQTEKESIRKMSLEEILKRAPEKGASAAEMAYMGRVNETVKKGLEASIKEGMDNFDDVVNGLRPDLLENFKVHLQVLGETNTRFLGTRGEIGRGLEYMKALQGETASAKYYDNIFKGLGAEALGNGNTATVTTIMQRLALMAPESRSLFLDAATKSRTPGITHSLYKTLLFANPATHVVNLLGQIQGGLIDAVQFTSSAMTPFKGADAPSIREAMALWAGITSASANLPRIIRQAVERSATSMEKIGLEGAQDIIAKYGTGRLLGFEDELVSGFLESGYVQSLATKEALERGLKGRALKSAVSNTLTSPEEVARLSELAKPMIQHAMFHDPLSGFGEKVTEAIRNSKVDFLMPVIRFPINSLKMSRDWTPGLQFLSKQFMDDVAAGGAREASARSRVALSWMMSQYIWSQAKAGNITGGGPRNFDANQIWQQASPKNRPYSIHGYNYRWAEPIATVVGFIADMAQAQNEADPDKVMDVVAASTLALSRTVTNNYWVRTIEGLSEIGADLEHTKSFAETAYSLGKVFAGPVKTVVQGGPLGRRFAEIQNPQVSDTSFYGEWGDLLNWGLADTPWGYKARPRLNMNGDPRILPPVLGHRWASFIAPPIRYSSDSGSKAAEFLDKHQVTVDDDWKSGKGTINPDLPLATPGTSSVRPNLSGDEAYNWKVLSLKGATNSAGKTWQERLDELDKDERFNSLSQPKKQQRVNRIYNQYQDQGWKLLLEVNPDVAAKDAAAKEETRRRKGLGMPQSEDLIDDGREAPVEYVPVESVPPGVASPSNTEGQVQVPTQ